MSTQKPNGGSAFPRAGDQFADPVDGMSLRDWFAGQALAGIADEHNGMAVNPRAMAQIAYTYADAMIAAREGGGA